MSAITLEEVKKGQLTDLEKGVIDEFQKGDYLFSNVPFDFIANPIAGGSGWTTSYVKSTEESKTAFRAINGKYEDTQAKKEMKTAEVKVYGGSFTIDRALKDQGGVENEVTFQMAQLIKAARKGFSYYLINGSTTTAGEQFDGLDTLLKKSVTDMEAHSTGFDLSTFDKVKENALEFSVKIDEWLALLDEKPHALLGNSTLITKIKACAKVIGLHTATQDNFGNTIDNYNGIPLITLGTYMPKGETVAKETIPIASDTNTTDLYAVRFGEDALCVASPSSGKVIDVIAPDFTKAEEQVRGLVELRGVPILRTTKSCGVLRKIKVK
ncbi:major capsid protein [uncultured Sneathia sp.]|uniref:major capsid protein n=1 Tax=uncultured Sneathia sp. TaxID=278067 RepID=UPI002594F2AF|nr:hypothetical protein [uncultured Sneathia sp.]